MLFGRSHLIAMVLTLAVSGLLVALTRRQRGADAPIRYGLATVLIADWVWWYWIAWQHGWLTVGDALPINLCDWATVATIIALLAPRQRAYELAYFWALCGTVQGMITPDTPYDFPEVRFLNFFIYHGGIIASVLYLTFGTGMRPVPRSIPRVIAWSFGYLAAAAIVDVALGTNYGFLRAKAPGQTLFGFMPEWPWYIPVLVALGVASAMLYYLPWFIADRIRKTPHEVGS
ncbi:MAG TPA: TIGR02206 family membrane protein [Rhizomicrobium sp.]